MLVFKVYLGKEDETDGTALAICLGLCEKAHLLTNRGHILFTDTYYTSIKLAKHMYEKHGWTIVGTISPTKKKQRNKEDFPFSKLSNGAQYMIPRGWYQEAEIKMHSPSGLIYYIQATTWRDKKQVCFVSTSQVGASVQ